MDVPNIMPPATSFHEKFEFKLTEYEQQHQGSQRKQWTTERILEVMNNIRKARVSMISKQSRTAMDYYWLSKYDIMVTANEDYLIFKRKSPEDPTVRIISRNEYFCILEETHKSCGHGGRDKMMHALKSRFYIPKKAIEIFLALCPTCKIKKALPKKGIVTQPMVSQDFNIRGQVDLMDDQMLFLEDSEQAVENGNEYLQQLDEEIYYPATSNHNNSVKKRKHENRQERERLISTERLLYKEKESSEIFGRYIGMQLQTIRADQRIIAEKLMSDVLYLARNNRLNENTGVLTQNVTENHDPDIKVLPI